MKRRELLKLGAAALTAGALCGCGSKRSAREVLLRYWTGWTGHELQVQRELIAEFNRSHPGIRVKILCVAGSYQKVPIAIAGGDTPDVCSAVWADQLYGYASRGALTPLDGYLARWGRSLNEWMPGVRRMLRYNGRTFALSTTANSNFIAYNRRIFAECGLDPDRPPQTIEELEEAAERTTLRDSRGNYIRYGLRPGGLQIWARVFGGDWYDEESGAITADHPGNVAALAWLQRWFKRYDIRKMETFEAGFGSLEASTGAFYTGKTAMWQTGEWAGENIRRYAPHLDWGYFPLPAPPGGRKNCVQLGGSVFVMPAACRHKDEAFEFLSWICGQYASRRFCREIHNIPPLIEAAQAPEFQSIPLMRDAIRLAGGENAFGPAPVAVWPMYQREIQRAEDRAIHGGGRPAELLKEVQRRVQREFEEAKRYAVF
mgnify:CR=1 FL=1